MRRQHSAAFRLPGMALLAQNGRMSIVIEGIGYLAAVTTAFIAIPQAVRAVKVGTHGVSALTFQLFLGLGFMWLAYGMSQHYLPAIPSNACQIVACTVTLVMCRRHGAKLLSVSSVAVLMVILTFASLALVGPIVMAWIAVAFGFLLRVPQIIGAARSHNVDGISLFTWWMATICNIFWFLYGLGHHDPRFIVTAALNGVSSYGIIRVVIWKRRSLSLRAQAAVSEIPAVTMG